MKKLLILFSFLICINALDLNAQTTNVTATVVDSDSITWANGTWSITFNPNPAYPNYGSYRINGAPLSTAVTSQTGTLTSGGGLSLTVYDSSQITPAGSGWTLNVCPLASAACGVYKFSTAGASMGIGANLTAIIPAPRFNALAGAYGYADLEAINTIPVGGTYYNDVTLCQRVYNGSSWSCASGGGGTVTTSGTVTPGFISMFSGLTSLTNSPLDYNITNPGYITSSQPFYEPGFLEPEILNNSVNQGCIYFQEEPAAGCNLFYTSLGFILEATGSGQGIHFRTNGQLNYDVAQILSTGLYLYSNNSGSASDLLHYTPQTLGLNVADIAGIQFENGSVAVSGGTLSGTTAVLNVANASTYFRPFQLITLANFTSNTCLNSGSPVSITGVTTSTISLLSSCTGTPGTGTILGFITGSQWQDTSGNYHFNPGAVNNGVASDYVEIQSTGISFPSTGNTAPEVGTPAVGQAACVKAAGPPVIIGYCSTVVSSSGSCTCN